MKRRRVAGGIVVLALTAATGLWWLESYRWAGGFRTVNPHFAGTCTAVEGAPGPEDLTIDRATGVAYVSTYDRAAAGRGEAIPGAILAYDIGSHDPHLVNMTPDAEPGFRPHGVSLYEDPDGGKRLFVISHQPDGERVEIFDVAPDRLGHVKTIRGDALTSPNDLVAVGPEQFYLTNSRRHSGGTFGWIEATFRMNWGNVVYYDGTAFSEAIASVGFPNGINVNRDRSRVYLVSSFDQAVRIYRRDAASGALTFDRSIEVGTRLDNVDVADTGDLWVAGRAQYLGSPQPSQVVRIRLDAGGVPKVDEVYVNLGDELGNASVAAVHGRHLLIGASRGARFLDCLMSPDTVGSPAP